MNPQNDLSASERRSPSGMLAYLRSQAEDARALSERSEAMAEKSAHHRFIVGLVSCLLPIPDLAHPIFEKMLLGIRGRLTANDCDLLLCATRMLGANEDLRRQAAIQTIEHVDAVIAWAIAPGDPECEPIIESGLPVIVVDNDILGARAGSVLSANVEGMASVVTHLYETGRRRIAHISGHFQTRPGTDRLFGYRSEVGKLGLDLPSEFVQEGDFFHESGYKAARRLLSLPDQPDAIATASDAMAVGAMAAIEEARLRIPEDVAVTGFDDAAYASELKPPLTTVRQDALGMGTAAAEAVLRMLEDPEVSPPVVSISTELVIRESSAGK